MRYGPWCAQRVLDSIDEEYARAAVCVVPLVLGSGVKIKLVEALSFGKATVSTSIGVEGLEGMVAGVVEVEDDPRRFAEAVLRLLADSALREERERAALAFTREHYNADAALPAGFLEALLG